MYFLVVSTLAQYPAPPMSPSSNWLLNCLNAVFKLTNFRLVPLIFSSFNILSSFSSFLGMRFFFFFTKIYFPPLSLSELNNYVY